MTVSRKYLKRSNRLACWIVPAVILMAAFLGVMLLFSKSDTAPGNKSAVEASMPLTESAEPSATQTNWSASLPPAEPALNTGAAVNAAQAEWYPQEQAMLDGCVVLQDGDVRHNQRTWIDFAEASGRGEPASVCVVQYSQSETGASYIRYDVSYDGETYHLNCLKDGEYITQTYRHLIRTSGALDDSWEPYDSYERYVLADVQDLMPQDMGSDSVEYNSAQMSVVLYEDLAAEPNFDGVTEIFLHMKQSNPPLKIYDNSAEVNAILGLLQHAQPMSSEPDTYLLLIKLIMYQADGNEIILELDYKQPVYRYGMQFYSYGTLEDMFTVLGIDQWPEEIQTEYNTYYSGHD